MPDSRSAAAPVSPSAPRRVLLVDDDAELRDALVIALGARGHRIDVVSDGRAALGYMRTHHPDVVLLDLMMPGMDGWEFRVEQRRDPALADTPVVAMSGSDSASARAIDADAFLSKPCTTATIAAAIDEVVARRERRAAATAHAQAERLAALGTLAAGVAHEINNPLTYLLLHLEHALRLLPVDSSELSAPTAAQVRSLIAGAVDGARRIRDITRDVRAFARADDDRPSALDLRGPLTAALGLIEHQLRHRARLVRVDGPAPFVRAEEHRLAQVFLNLLANAVQALPDGDPERHEIRVTTDVDELGRAVIEIADTGAGIAPHVLPRVFEPFFTTRPVGEGTGLGLSISHGIVQSLGGTLELTSELGVGTRVRVVLPAAHAVAPSAT